MFAEKQFSIKTKDKNTMSCLELSLLSSKSVSRAPTKL